jgi:resuscitation-promoting factor RpfB
VKVRTFVGTAAVAAFVLAGMDKAGPSVAKAAANAAGGVAASVASAPAAPANIGGNVALGRRLASDRGWTGQQWNCLYALWTRESGWSNTADNSQSGAYGIAQALGHGPTNQYPAGPANPPTSSASAQVRWGLGYIAGRYGTPCAAWNHEEANNWY